MAIPWRMLLVKVGKWLVRKGAEEALREIQKRKDRHAPEAGNLRVRDVVEPNGDPRAQDGTTARADE